jgi:hypothetical protein
MLAYDVFRGWQTLRVSSSRSSFRKSQNLLGLSLTTVTDNTTFHSSFLRTDIPYLNNVGANSFPSNVETPISKQ